MNVLKFIPRFSPLYETFIYFLAIALQKREPTLRVMTFSRENAQERPFNPVDIHPSVGNPIFERLARTSPLLEPLTQHLPLFNGQSAVDRLCNYLEEHRIQVVHAHFALAGYLIANACHRLNIPLIVSLRGYDASRTLSKKRWHFAYRWLFNRCSTVVSVSEEMRQRIQHLVPSKTNSITIRAGKSIASYPYRPRSHPVEKFVSIGRLVEKKGHDVLIKAVALCNTHGRKFDLEIIGGGPEYDKLTRLAHDCQVNELVTLSGDLPHSEAMRRLSLADAFVLASRTSKDGNKEGIPNVIKEAQLLGVPVISTDHAGIPEAIPTCNRLWLAPEGSPEALASLMEKLSLLDLGSIEQMTDAAREHIENSFSLESEVNQYLSLYERSISK